MRSTEVDTKIEEQTTRESVETETAIQDVEIKVEEEEDATEQEVVQATIPKLETEEEEEEVAGSRGSTGCNDRD